MCGELYGEVWQGPHRDVLYLQDEGGDVPGGQAPADGVTDALHQLRAEFLIGRHLQEEDDTLLPIIVVLGHAQAVGHLLKGLH